MDSRKAVHFKYKKPAHMRGLKTFIMFCGFSCHAA